MYKLPLISLFLIILYTIFLSKTCFALPGQDVSQITIWAEKKAVIGKLKKVSNPYNGQITYNNYSNNTSIDFLLVTSPLNPSVSEYETLSTEKKPTKRPFIRTDSSTYDLITNIYTKEIAEDFKQAKFRTKFKTKYGSKLVQVFKGKKYSYFNFSKELHIRKLSTLEADIENYKNFYGMPE